MFICTHKHTHLHTCLLALLVLQLPPNLEDARSVAKMVAWDNKMRHPGIYLLEDLSLFCWLHLRSGRMSLRTKPLQTGGQKCGTSCEPSSPQLVPYGSCQNLFSSSHNPGGDKVVLAEKEREQLERGRRLPNKSDDRGLTQARETETGSRTGEGPNPRLTGGCPWN